jgi:hypothetical protein
MNGPTLDMCSKCKEPVTHEQKLAQSIDKERAVRAGGVAKLPPAPASPVAVRAAAAVISKPSAPAGLPPPPPRQPARSSGTGGGGGGGNENKISKANIHGTVHSKLNHATASYQAKFEKDGPPQKGANVQTLKSMTVNGFVSSATRDRAAKAAAAPQVSKPHEAPPVKIRPKYQSGGGVSVGAASSAAAPAAAEPKKYFNPIEEKPLKKWTGPETGRGGLINMLQEACSGAAQASLKHVGPTHKPEYKSLDGYQTAFQM